LAGDPGCYRRQHDGRHHRLLDGLRRQARVRKGTADALVRLAAALRCEDDDAVVAARHRRSDLPAGRLAETAVLGMRGLHGDRQVSALSDDDRLAAVRAGRILACAGASVLTWKMPVTGRPEAG